MLADQRVRVLARWQGGQAQGAFGGEHGQRHLGGAGGGAGAGGIAIKAQHGLGAHRPEGFELLRGQRRAEWGHRAGEAGLMQGDDIHIALHRDQPGAAEDALARQMQAIKLAPLGKQRRLRAIHVFRLTIAEDAAAEADATPAAVMDGEHHPVEEEIDQALLALLHQPGLEQLGGLDAQFAQIAGQRATAGAGPAQAEGGDGGGREAALEQVIQRRPALGQMQAAGEGGLGGIEHAMQVPRPGLSRGHFWGGFGDGEAGLAGQALHRFDEARAVGAHHKADGIAMRAAAKAMEAVVVDVEAGGLLAMKGAAALPLPAGFQQPDLARHQRLHGGAGAQLVQELRGQRHGMQVVPGGVRWKGPGLCDLGMMPPGGLPRPPSPAMQRG